MFVKNSAVMDVRDPNDPEGRIRGFQFVKKRMNDAYKVTEKLQGTKSDLRRLTKEEAINLLIEISAGQISREEIEKMGRWARLREIATLSKKAMQMGTGQDLHKFARNTRSTYFENDAYDFKQFKKDW